MIEMLGTFLNSIFGFLILMGILVTIHEFGHFYVAKKLGFTVLKFSIGFGKAIWTRTGKDGVEYQIGIIPLGGYVAMLDERAEKVAPEDLHKTFNAKPLWKRTCVVAAGPFANIALATVLLWGLYSFGMPALKPYVGTPLPESPFAVAGVQNKDLVLSVDGHPVATYEELVYRLLEYLDDGKADIKVLRDNKVEMLSVDLGGALKLRAEKNLDEVLGLKMYFPKIPAVIGGIREGSIAAISNLQVGDKLTRLHDFKIETWQDILSSVQYLNQEKFEGEVVAEVKRNGELKEVSLLLPKKGSEPFILGIEVAEPPAEVREEIREMRTVQKFGLAGALKHAVIDTYGDAQLIFKFVYRMITGKIHINTMAGPITIADVAGKTMQAGLVYFIKLIALFSINIGIINLLPIPVLDGGRLVGFAIEKVVGKDRIPERFSMMVLQMGALLIFGFMGIVIMFDILRLF